MERSIPIEKACMDAMHELLQTKMLSRITVQDILAAVGISRATFYRHYRDREDLFEKMIRRDVDSVFTNVCDLDRWRTRAEKFAESLRADKKVLYKMVRSDPGGFQTFYTNILYELLLKRLYRLHDEGFAVTPALRRRFLYMSAGAAAALGDWIQGGCAESPQEIGLEISALFHESGVTTVLEKNS